MLAPSQAPSHGPGMTGAPVVEIDAAREADARQVYTDRRAVRAAPKVAGVAGTPRARGQARAGRAIARFPTIPGGREDGRVLFPVEHVSKGRIVIEAASATVEQGWWMFRTSEGTTLAVLPAAEVERVETLAAPPPAGER